MECALVDGRYEEAARLRDEFKRSVRPSEVRMGRMGDIHVQHM